MRRMFSIGIALAAIGFASWQMLSAQPPAEDFPTVMAKMKAAKSEIQ